MENSRRKNLGVRILVLFWQEKEKESCWQLLCEPAALLLTLNKKRNGEDEYFLKCLGETKIFKISSLENAQKYAEKWLCDFLRRIAFILENRGS